jgi:hypothetical protein
MSIGEQVIVFTGDDVNADALSGKFLEWVTPDVAIVITDDGERVYTKEVYLR